MAGIWILAENRELTLELMNIGKRLASSMRAPLSVMLCHDVDRAQDYVNLGADEVLLLPPLAEQAAFDAYTPLISEEAAKADIDVFLISATSRGKDIAARLAAKLNTGLCSGCMSIIFDNESKTLIMERLAFGGAAVQKVTCTARPVMATIAPKTYEPISHKEDRLGSIRELPAQPCHFAIKILERKVRERQSVNIAEAKVIVSVGRGIDKKEDLDLVQRLADALGGEIACTRPISEELKWLPDELCIGLSGIQVKPDFYLGIGVSGQIQHVTGIRNAKIIAAINKDENAPIFKVADLGIVGDLYDVIPKLITELNR